MLYKGEEAVGKWIVIVDNGEIDSDLHWNFDGSILMVRAFENHKNVTISLTKLKANEPSSYTGRYFISSTEDDYIEDEEFTVGCKFVEELTKGDALYYGDNVLQKWLELQQEPLSLESSTLTNTITPPEDKTSENENTGLTWSNKVKVENLSNLISLLGIDTTLCIHSVSGVTTYEIYSEEELLNFTCKDINVMVEYLGKVKGLIDWRKDNGSVV